MDRLSLDGAPRIDVTLRTSPRARRLTLRVAPSGEVVLTRPLRVARAEAVAFARAKRDWIAARLVGTGPRRPRIGGTIPFRGSEAPIREGRERIEGGAVHVAGAPGPSAARLLKAHARAALTESAGRYAAVLGRPHGRITLRDTRSRWGSCSERGDLSFSWRLAMAPPEVLDYIAAHEVAHLARMDHSPAYWAGLARLMPGYEAPRRWLKEHGRGLLAWDFA